jgi:beta-fructofuranosidase
VSIWITPFLSHAQTPVPHTPVIEGESWRICESPDLDSLNGPDLSKQHVVDHGFIQDATGKWHLWACIRGTRVGRLLYGWEGESLEDGPWTHTGIKARADTTWGEQKGEQESIQAPYFMQIDGKYYCFYNSVGIRMMTSADGAHYQREKVKDNNNILYEKGGRDVMVMEDDGKYYAYSTVTTVARDGWLWGFVIVRTSTDLNNWGDYTIVSEGGRAGNGPVSAESPFVQKYQGYYYLFRASSVTGTTFVYRSEDPYNFGVNDDSKLVAELPIKAPEIIYHEGQWYISDLADFKGIKLARLQWEPVQ